MSTISESIKKRWQDPEYRARQAAARVAGNAKRAEIMKQQWQDPAMRAKRVEAIASPEVRAKMSASHSRVMREAWNNSEYRERQSERNAETARSRKGSLNGNFKDGLRNGPRRRAEYNAYHMAKQRCDNPNNPGYQDYGLRGIEFRFTSFDEFIAHIGPRPSASHSLERTNNNGHYEIGNVQWATDTEQVSNRRKANSHCRQCGGILVCQACKEGEPVTFAMVPTAA